MSLYKSGMNLPCMERESGTLDPREMAIVVASFSYEGLQMAAALGISLANRCGMTSKEIDSLLNDMLASATPKSKPQEAIA